MTGLQREEGSGGWQSSCDPDADSLRKHRTMHHCSLPVWVCAYMCITCVYPCVWPAAQCVCAIQWLWLCVCVCVCVCWLALAGHQTLKRISQRATWNPGYSFVCVCVLVWEFLGSPELSFEGIRKRRRWPRNSNPSGQRSGPRASTERGERDGCVSVLPLFCDETDKTRRRARRGEITAETSPTVARHVNNFTQTQRQGRTQARGGK